MKNLGRHKIFVEHFSDAPWPSSSDFLGARKLFSVSTVGIQLVNKRDRKSVV